MKSFVFSGLTIGLLHYYIITLNEKIRRFNKVCVANVRNAWALQNLGTYSHRT